MKTSRPLRSNRVVGRSLATAALLFAATGNPAPAQQPVPASPEDRNEIVTLNAVTVTTATRSSKAIDHIAGAISVVTPSDLAQQLIVDEDPVKILELNVPGYSPSRASLSDTGVTLRGRTVLYLLDGIPLSTPLREGTREVSGFADMSIIERVEVINGPSATEGLGAAGGIVNFITKTPRANEATAVAKVSSQFQSNNLSWKSGVSFARKENAFDILVSAGITETAMQYDADGHAIGFDTNGDTEDSRAHNFFLKAGRNFGVQRVEFMLNRFDIAGNANYHRVPGNRAKGILTTSARGAPAVGKPQSNDMQDMSLEWHDSNLAQGEMTIQLYQSRFAALFEGSIDVAKQDPAFAPVGTLVDQAQILAKKHGARAYWVRPNLFVDGVELNLGIDLLHDETEQLLQLTGRTWVPPLKYDSHAPFAQLEYERGPFTIRGGVRFENAKLAVDTYKTLYVQGSQTVQGGSRSYSQAIKNLGAIARLPFGWSVYASYSEGYSIPDVGLLLRGVNKPNQTVAGLVELKPIIAKNNEAGFTWRNPRASFGASYYQSTSDLGSQLVIDPVTLNGRTVRVPVDIKGWEATGDVKLTTTLTLNALFSHIHGKTAVTEGTPTNLDLGARSQPPTKIASGLAWKFLPNGTVKLQMAKYLSRHINLGRFNGTSKLQEDFGGYTVFDLSAGCRTRWGEIGLGVENLLNRQYVGYFSQADAGSQTNNNNYIAGRGRTVSLSDTLRF
ncbi:MAG: TonB-dependent receptor [Verrucomicrobia bacterium]|nr:TonB-dependent receptor [Verrucomicrobiota bacterium]